MRSKNILGGAILVSGVALGSSVASAQTIDILFDPQGTGVAANAVLVDVFDWAPGNALAINGNPVGTGPVVGGTTDVLANAALATLQLDGANLVLPAFPELTFVSGFNETFASVLGNTAITVVNPGAPLAFNGAAAFFEIWSDQPAALDANGLPTIPLGGGPVSLSNDLTGFGFNDGTLVLAGTIATGLGNQSAVSVISPLDSFGADDWAANGFPQSTAAAVGGSSIALQINFATDFVNPFFFPNPGLAPNNFNLTLFNNSQILPFSQVDPAECFVQSGGGASVSSCNNLFDVADAGTGGFNTPGTLGAINAIPGAANGPNAMFQQDANQSFQAQVVPEPATLALLGMGLAGLGLAGRARRRRGAAA